MSGYIGTQPVPQATQTRDAFTCTAGQTSFATGGYTPQFLDVYLNGIKLAAADYTASNGSDVVLASGAALNDILEIVAYSSFEVVTDTVTNAGTVLNLDRTGSDGTILDLKKDGSTVGSIGVYANEYYHGSAVGGDTFLRHGYSAIVPATSSGANRDAAINLGASTNRFKDLYLSGGVYLGGTDSANKLDDYETGQFNAHIYDDSGQITSHSGQANYVKIGEICHLTIEIYANGVTSTSVDGKAWINIPFVGQARTNAIFLPHYYNGMGSIVAGYINGTVQRLYLTSNRDEPFGNNVGGTTIGGTMRLYGSLTYRTA